MVKELATERVRVRELLDSFIFVSSHPVAQRNSETHLWACSQFLGDPLFERIAEHWFDVGAFDQVLEWDFHRILDEQMVEEGASAFQAVRHADDVDFREKVTWKVAEHVGSHGFEAIAHIG